MDGANQNFSQLMGRFKTELGRDKKKTVILVILLVAAGIVGGKFLVRSPSPSPSAAIADTDNRLPAAAGQTALAQVLTETDQADRDEYIARLDRTITRDLFSADPRYFPPASGDTGESTPGNEPQPPEQTRQERIAAIRAEADGLTLQTTMLGESPTAMIDGKVLRIGDSVSGFRVEAIASDRCVVSKDGVNVELRMKQ